MQDIDGKSLDILEDNVNKLKNLFPEAFVEGKVDFDKLKVILGDVLDEETEKYNLTWRGKGVANRSVESRSSGTLRPCVNESVNWDKTGNIFIEGENLEVLKLLQKSYAKKIKMIYIDPPYNTGKDFIYNDDYIDGIRNYKKITEQVDDNGRNLSNNPETSGRYHTDWLNMMYPRLKLARSLLSDDGAIFISIDDNEQSNLKLICNEIYGEENFITQLVWEKKRKGTFLSKTISSVKEYIMVYAKNRNNFEGLIGEINNEEETYPCINESNKKKIITIPKGVPSKYPLKDYVLEKGETISARTMELKLHSDLVIEDGKLAQDVTIEGNWRHSPKNMVEFANEGKLFFTKGLLLRRIVKEPRHKTLKDLLPRAGESKVSSSKSLDINNLFADGWGSNEDGEEELRELLGKKSIMEFPKPMKLIEKLCISMRDKEAIILDFFAGSATTAHAVMHLNSIDDGKRRFIVIQLPELCKQGSEARKAGFLSIAEIGKERIRNAINKIKESDLKYQVDFGFKVFKLDDTNIKPWDENVDWVDFELEDYVDNVKSDRSNLDILYEILLKFGFDLAVPITKINILGDVVYSIENGKILVCLSDDISLQLVDGIVAQKEIAISNHTRIVFKESGFADDVIKTNTMQILKQSGIVDVRSF